MPFTLQTKGQGVVQGSLQVGYTGATFTVTYYFPSSGGGTPSFDVQPKNAGGIKMDAQAPAIAGSVMNCQLTSS